MESLVEDGFRKRLDAGEPGFEVVPTSDFAVDFGAIVETVAGGVGEVPVGSVEAIAVIDHGGYQTSHGVFGVWDFVFAGEDVEETGTIEDGLPGVRVGGPFIEGEDG